MVISLSLHSILVAQVLINEVMPVPGPGATTDPCAQSMINERNPDCGREWVELYNTDPCYSIDLGCYYLGACTRYGNYNTGVYNFPEGTIVEPNGFLTIGGPQTGADLIISEGHYCTGNRWFLENHGGWVALFDPSGNPVDLVYWSHRSNDEEVIFHDRETYSNPIRCSTNGCGDSFIFKGALEIIHDLEGDFYAGVVPPQGLSIRRIPDGDQWRGYGIPSQGQCNENCQAELHILDCDSIQHETFPNAHDGVVVLTWSGGKSPFNLIFNDIQTITTNERKSKLQNLEPGMYTVEIIDANDCSDFCVFEIESYTCRMHVDLIASGKICPDSCNGSLKPMINNYHGQLLFMWNHGATHAELSNLCPGTYSLEVRDQLDCSAYAEYSFQVTPSHNLGLSKIILDENKSLFEVTLITDLDTSLVGSVIWKPDSLFNNDGVEFTKILQLVNTDHLSLSAYMMDRWGCQSKANLHLEALEDFSIYIPSGFSPNNDGINDTFQFFTNNDDMVKKVNTFQIYDRWGNIVHLERDILLQELKGWNGKNNLSELLSGTFLYYFEIELKSGRSLQYKGEITAMR